MGGKISKWGKRKSLGKEWAEKGSGLKETRILSLGETDSTDVSGQQAEAVWRL